MTAVQDYVYRYSNKHLPMAGRCRVRIYTRTNGARTVLLTELEDNPGEPISSVCEQIVTDLTTRWKLDVLATRWVQQDTTQAGHTTGFDELQFSWDHERRASQAQWHGLDSGGVEAVTGELISTLNTRIGESGAWVEGE